MDMVYGWITDFEHIAWQFNSPTEFDFTNARTEDDEDQVLFFVPFPKNGWYGDVHKWMYRGVTQEWLVYNGKSMKIWMILGETLWIPCGSSGWMWMVYRKNLFHCSKKGRSCRQWIPTWKLRQIVLLVISKLGHWSHPKTDFQVTYPRYLTFSWWTSSVDCCRAGHFPGGRSLDTNQNGHHTRQRFFESDQCWWLFFLGDGRRVEEDYYLLTLVIWYSYGKSPCQ